MIPEDVKERLGKADIEPSSIDWYAGRMTGSGWSETPLAEAAELREAAIQRRRENPGPVRRLFRR